jgi:hypothetical protein
MLKLKNCFTVFLLIAIVLISGCASILSKSNYPVAINSSPDQANFTITNKNGQSVHSGTTPSTVTLKSGCGFFCGEQYNLTFDKDGYSSTTLTISSTMDGWYVGNILFGGLIGILIVDPITGAMWKLPATVQTNMKEKKITLNTTKKSLHILSYNSLSDSTKANLTKIQQ